MSFFSVMVALFSACSAISAHNLMVQDARGKIKGHSSLIHWKRFSVFIGNSLLLTSRCLVMAAFLSAWGYWITLFLTGHVLLITTILYVTNEFSMNKRPVNIKAVAAWLGQCVEWLELDIRATKWEFIAFYTTVGVENIAVAVSFVILNGLSSDDTIIGAIVALCYIVGLFVKIITIITCPFLNNEGLGQLRAHCPPPTESLYRIPQVLSDTKCEEQQVGGSPLGQDILQGYSNLAYVYDNYEDLSTHVHDAAIVEFDSAGQDDSGFLSRAEETIEEMLSSPVKTSHGAREHIAQVHVPFDNSITAERNYAPDVANVLGIPFYSTPQKTRDYSTAEILLHEQYNGPSADDSRALPGHPLHPGQIPSSISSQSSSVSCTHCTCTSTFCEVCHCAWAPTTSSSELDSLSDILRGDLDIDLAMTWPPRRKVTIENLSNLPTHTLSCQENVHKWLSKSHREDMYK
jgi:hypothetical protein